MKQSNNRDFHSLSEAGVPQTMDYDPNWGRHGHYLVSQRTHGVCVVSGIPTESCLIGPCKVYCVSF